MCDQQQQTANGVPTEDDAWIQLDLYAELGVIWIGEESQKPLDK